MLRTLAMRVVLMLVKSTAAVRPCPELALERDADVRRARQPEVRIDVVHGLPDAVLRARRAGSAAPS